MDELVEYLLIFLPLLALIMIVKTRSSALKSSKKGLIVGAIIGGAVVVLYLIWNFFYRI